MNYNKAIDIYILSLQKNSIIIFLLALIKYNFFRDKKLLKNETRLIDLEKFLINIFELH